MIKKNDKTAIVYKGISYSYTRLLQYSSCYASYFSQKEELQKVMIFADNCPEYFFAFYGALRCGAIVIPVDVSSSISELAYILADSNPDFIFTSLEKREMVEKVRTQAGITGHIITAGDIHISAVDTVEVTEIPDGPDEKIMLIIYTSGTTGSPKGVMLSYRNILFMVHAVSEDVPIFSRERNVMVLLPLHHILPIMGTLVCPMKLGATVYIAEGLNADSILKTLNEGKIALIVGVPRLYETLAKGVMAKINAKFVSRIIYKIAKLIGSDGLSKLIFRAVHQKFGGHLQYLICGGAALPTNIAIVFKALGFYIIEGYGMTETSPIISFTHPGKRKIGYAGFPLKGMDIKIESNGEICVRGENVMQGYYRRPEETAHIIRNGWLHTGDIGLLDKYGLKLTGRLKEIMVTSNGKNINPEEVEHEAMQHTQYIREIGVFMHDSVIQAIVVPEMKELRQSTEGNIVETIRNDIDSFNKITSVYKRIKRIHISSEDLPKTRLGKIQRFCLPLLMEQTKAKTRNKPDDANQSKVYQLLKVFIESETGYIPAANDHFEIDLSMDSLSRVALLNYVETSFGLIIKEELLDSLNTLAKLTEYVEQNSPEISTHKEISWKNLLSTEISGADIPRPGMIHFLIDTFVKIIFRTAYRFRGKGEENIPNEPCIIVANHRSALDGLTITARLKYKIARNTFFFAKEKYWRTKFARFMAGKNNVLLMDINKNVKESLQQISHILQQGKNIIIFPEGTRSREKGMKQFKNAFAILSTELKVPVVPVAISGSDRAVFRPFKLPRFFARICVEFLPPVYPQPAQSAENLRDDVERQIRNMLE
jgi:long-chain acyl-CoA synthetase